MAFFVQQTSPNFLIVFCLLFCACTNTNTDTQVVNTTGIGIISQASNTPTIDGNSTDAAWATEAWRPLDQFWIGDSVSRDDFSGRYKLLWDEAFIYVLAEIKDDTLIDIHEDGLLKYWDDDCLEIFVDADASGGNHQYNYNAFAYHLSLDGRVVDVKADSSFAYFDDHCTFKRTTSDNKSIWEVAVRIYPDNYTDGGENIPLSLSKGKKMGFALAYCDNDRSAERENFIGSVFVPGKDKNRGWIDAGIFETLELQGAE